MANPEEPTESTPSAWSSDTPVEPTASDVPDAGTATAGTTAAGRGSRRGIVIAAIVAVLVLGGVVGALLANRGDDHRTTIDVDRTSSDQQMPGADPRGVDPDGDDWTGGGGRRPHDESDDHHGPRGIDPDGDDWMGGGPHGGPTTTVPGA